CLLWLTRRYHARFWAWPHRPAGHQLLSRRYGRNNTFNTPLVAARRIAWTPFASGYSSLIKLSTSTAFFFSRSSAGLKRPQRDPTIEISSTTMGAVSSSVFP